MVNPLTVLKERQGAVGCVLTINGKAPSRGVKGAPPLASLPERGERPAVGPVSWMGNYNSRAN